MAKFILDNSVFGKAHNRANEFCMNLIVHGGILKIIEEDAKLKVSKSCLDESDRKIHIDMVTEIVNARDDISNVLFAWGQKGVQS
jgi:hypothetical protein